MKLILHIGMGKTGTSSIQLALSQSAEKLKTQHARYLGMWFDMIDPSFRGVVNQSKFFSQTPDTLQSQAITFYGIIEKIALEEHVDTFIISNEAFSGQASVLKPFLDEVTKRGNEVRVIGYVRNPGSWLPSAYIQWGIRDKTQKGPVPSYEKMARILVNWYNGLIEWSNLMRDILDVRHYDAVGDIVTDFAQAAGLDLEIPADRMLERGEDCEILLRALFANRFPQQVLPSLFNRAVTGNSKSYPLLEESLVRYFDYQSTEQIINDNRALFERCKESLGIDLLADIPDLPRVPEIDDIRTRLIDYLVEISLDQARRITNLEREIAEIKTQLGQHG